jgi:toxin ParE1/3/4
VRLVRFAPRAIADLAAIRDYLLQAHPPAAAPVVRRIIDRGVALDEQPDRGAPRSRLGRGVRCLVEEPYLIFYRRDDDAVVILRVLHAARRITRTMLRDG